MSVLLLMAGLMVAIAFETILANLPLHIISLLNPSPLVVWGGLLLILGWCLGE